jgi:hypothetical protein
MAGIEVRTMASHPPLPALRGITAKGLRTVTCVTPKERKPTPKKGHEQIFRDIPPMSALPPKADIAECDGDVCFVP